MTPLPKTTIHLHDQQLTVTGSDALDGDLSLCLMSFVVGLLRTGLAPEMGAAMARKSLETGFDLTITEDADGFVFDAGNGLPVAGPIIASYLLAMSGRHTPSAGTDAA